jgi:1,4-dihydroxy-6-naphthoate synthase
MKLTLGFSQCPNDTFIFDAMVHGRIDTEGLEFDYFLSDVEELNRKALFSKVDILKVSYHAYAYFADKYLILDSGSALGLRNGPLVISSRVIDSADLNRARIAIPGKYTTANLLFSIAWPEAKNKKEYLFSDIVGAMLKDEVDAGLIIHETRFTYAKKGLIKIADLGEFWENLTGLPIPLGAIVINRNIPQNIALKVNRIIRKSLEHAYKDSFASYQFVASNANDMDSTVMNNHIKLFVNDYTLNLGNKGKEAINEMFRIGYEKGVIPSLPDRIFLSSK